MATCSGKKIFTRVSLNFSFIYLAIFSTIPGKMKKYFLPAFLTFIIISHLAAQSYVTLTPSRSSEKVPPVSTVGHYVSVGTGLIIISPMNEFALNGSYSYAYRSHLFSVSGITSGSLSGGGSYESWFNYSSIGLLAGESLRARHWLLSASAGIGIADMKYHREISNHNNNNDVDYRGTSASLPAEIKLFFLASHFGLGFHFFTDFTAKQKPYAITANLVFGTWRKPKEPKQE